MIGYSWEGSVPGSSACGISDDEGRAVRSAEAWLQANPGGTVRVGKAVLTDIGTALTPWWEPSGPQMMSYDREDGGIGWRLASALPSET